jgi:5'-3' exonuclease
MLIDGAGLWFRAYFAVPDKITAPDGRPVNAVRGFVDMLASLIVREQPSRLVVCLDVNWRPHFRTALIPSYKAHRVAEVATDPTGADVEEVPDTLTPQVDMIMDVLTAAGIATAGADDCEADDVIGTLADGESTDPVVVVSGDRDLLQVVADDPVPVRVLYVGRGLAKAEMFGPVEVSEKYGVPAARAGTSYAEMAMLRGDPSDGLPGVTGIGDKTAAKLISTFGDLDGVEAAARDGAKGISPRNRAALLESEGYLKAARTVVFVRPDAPVEFDRDDPVPTGPADRKRLDEIADELGIANSLRRLGDALGWTG